MTHIVSPICLLLQHSHGTIHFAIWIRARACVRSSSATGNPPVLVRVNTGPYGLRATEFDWNKFRGLQARGHANIANRDGYFLGHSTGTFYATVLDLLGKLREKYMKKTKSLFKGKKGKARALVVSNKVTLKFWHAMKEDLLNRMTVLCQRFRPHACGLHACVANILT